MRVLYRSVNMTDMSTEDVVDEKFYIFASLTKFIDVRCMLITPASHQRPKGYMARFYIAEQAAENSVTIGNCTAYTSGCCLVQQRLL